MTERQSSMSRAKQNSDDALLLSEFDGDSVVLGLSKVDMEFVLVHLNSPTVQPAAYIRKGSQLIMPAATRDAVLAHYPDLERLISLNVRAFNDVPVRPDQSQIDEYMHQTVATIVGILNAEFPDFKTLDVLPTKGSWRLPVGSDNGYVVFDHMGRRYAARMNEASEQTRHGRDGWLNARGGVDVQIVAPESVESEHVWYGYIFNDTDFGYEGSADYPEPREFPEFEDYISRCFQMMVDRQTKGLNVYIYGRKL